jgi:hypothetical protein
MMRCVKEKGVKCEKKKKESCESTVTMDHGMNTNSKIER